MLISGFGTIRSDNFSSRLDLRKYLTYLIFSVNSLVFLKYDTKNIEIPLFVHFLAPFFLLALVSAETMESDQVGSKTGNRLAVLEFGSKGISAPMKILLTEQFRETLKKLNMYEVLDQGFTDRVEIFYPGEAVYGECTTLRCIIELGKMLGVNYLVSGTINEKNDEYFIEGRLF